MRTSTFRTLISLLVVSVGLGANGWAGTLVNWIGPTGMGGDGNWGTASDWSGGVVPNNGGGNTYSVTLPNYHPMNLYNVRLDMSLTIDNLTLDPNSGLNLVQPHTLTTASVTNAGSIQASNGGP
jgi:hypothetical protein